MEKGDKNVSSGYKRLYWDTIPNNVSNLNLDLIVYTYHEHKPLVTFMNLTIKCSCEIRIDTTIVKNFGDHWSIEYVFEQGTHLIFDTKDLSVVKFPPELACPYHIE